MNIQKMRKAQGFTLIELMIVVAIIGILAAVAIPKFADLVTKSKEAGLKGNLGSVRSAMSIYYGDTEGINPSNGNLYTSLTNGSKYLPTSGGFGNFTIPSVSSMGNPGHEGGLVNAESKIKYTGSASVGDTATTTPIGYDSTIGSIWIDCTDRDTKGTRWTAY